jgi:hypothetical protein
MASEQGKESGAPIPEGAESEEPISDEEAGLTGIPDMFRRVLTMGLSGFFLGETAVRKALGDTVPKEWTDFAAEQSERTRGEFIERLTFEVARSLESVDLASVLQQMLEGRTLEIKAEIRLGEREEGASGKPLKIAFSDSKRSP